MSSKTNLPADDIDSPFNACMYRNGCRAEHTQRITLQHHAADMAQSLADEQQAHADTRCAHDNLARLLRQERDTASREYHQQREDAQARVDAAVVRAMAAEKERDTARGAVRELERQVFALQQQRDVLQTCLDRHQRDEADPPGYLQDAVIRAAGLGALHTELDAATKERDALAERLRQIEAPQ